jgi:hypothetical protein
MSALADHHDQPAPARLACRFTVLGEADPGLLSRLIEPFAKRGLMPRRLEAQSDGVVLRVSLAAELEADAAPLLAASLRAIVGVTTVLAEPG